MFRTLMAMVLIGFFAAGCNTMAGAGKAYTNPGLDLKDFIGAKFVTATISQSYYTDARAAQYDRNYQSSGYEQQRPSNFSPVALQVRSSRRRGPGRRARGSATPTTSRGR